MGIRTYYKRAGEGIIFQHHLVNDAGAGLPEAHAVLGARRGEEFVDFVIGLVRHLQVRAGADLGADQVIAMDGGGHGGGFTPGGNKLENRHLRRGVLHGHPIGSQIHRGHAARRQLARRILRRSCASCARGIRTSLYSTVSKEDLFRQGHGPTQLFAHRR